MAAESQKLAWHFARANERYARDYPAAVGQHMTNTDSDPFKDLIPAISLRENERGTQIGAGWDPQWHQPTDLYSTYSDAGADHARRHRRARGSDDGEVSGLLANGRVRLFDGDSRISRTRRTTLAVWWSR
jgi:hypothetical protein